MKRVFRILAGTAALALLSWSLPAYPAQAPRERVFRIVVNDSNPETAISRDELSQLFLKKTANWDHGVKVAPVDLPRSSETRKRFTREIHGKSVSAIRSYWQRIVFSGRDTPAPELQADSEVIDYVASRPGAIGYVSTGAKLVAGVREIAILE